MVLGSLFELLEFSVANGSISASLRVHGDHKIFQGHFPGQPVLPGVTMMQLMKELVEKALGKKLTLVEGDNVKFLAVVDPNVNPELNVQIAFTYGEDGKISLNSSLFAGSVTFFKLKALLKDIGQ